MLKKFLLCLIVLGSMLIGYMVGFINRPGLMVFEPIVKEVKIYDLSQEPKMIECYAGMMGKTLQDKKEIDEYFEQEREKFEQEREKLQKALDNRKNEADYIKHQMWQAGYQVGFSEAMRKKW